MRDKLTRGELVKLVEKILNVEGNEEEVTTWVNRFEQNVPHPEASGLIFWPNMYGLGDDPSAGKIVDEALNYKPIEL
ncbi:MAG: bacteriocin immunity protein [Chloroflexota bacterium]|nr:bacteriocin immunity protein [Chloroflexota bacterium]